MPDELKKTSTLSNKNLIELPEELLEKILGLLNIRDLAAFSRVSKSWRSAVNLDNFWKKLCRKEGFLPKLKDNTPTHLFVDPNDSSGVSEEEDGLEPLCYWRQIFGWYKTLSKNWRTKMFQRFMLAETKSPVYCLDCDGNTAITGHGDSSITIWSVKAIPHHIQTMNAILKDYPVVSVRTTSKYVVALQKKLLQVYHAKNGRYELSDVKSFELGDENVEQMDRVQELGENYGTWYKECLRVSDDNIGLVIRPLVYSLSGDQLFASCCGSGIVRMWTLPGSEVVTGKTGLSEIQQIETDENDVYFIVHSDSTILMKCALHEVHMLLSLPGLKRFVIGENLIMAVPAPGDTCLKRIWIWKKGDYKKPVGTKSISSSHFCAVFAKPRYVIYSEDTFIHVWDPIKNEMFSSFSVGSTIGFIRPGFASTVIVFMNASLHLWDLVTGKRLYRFYTGLEWTGDYRHLVWIDPSMILSAGVNHQLEMLSFL